MLKCQYTEINSSSWKKFVVHRGGRLRNLLVVLTEEGYRCYLHADDKKTFSWYFRQRGMVVCYQRFGTAYRSKKTAWHLKMGPDRLSRNVGNKGPIYPAQTSFTPRRKPEITREDRFTLSVQLEGDGTDKDVLRKWHFAFLETRNRVLEPVIWWKFLLAKLQECGPFDYPGTVRPKHTVTTVPIFI